MKLNVLILSKHIFFYKTGQKVGDIQSPTSILKKGIAGGLMGKHHLQLMHIAVDFAWNYFAKELNNSFTEEK